MFEKVYKSFHQFLKWICILFDKSWYLVGEKELQLLTRAWCLISRLMSSGWNLQHSDEECDLKILMGLEVFFGFFRKIISSMTNSGWNSQMIPRSSKQAPRKFCLLKIFTSTDYCEIVDLCFSIIFTLRCFSVFSPKKANEFGND